MIFSGLSNPHHQAFEVVGAKRIDSGTIRFYVWLYEYYTNTSPTPINRSKPYVMDIVKVSEDQWLVGNLPKEVQ